MRYLIKTIASLHPGDVEKYIVGDYPIDLYDNKKNYYEFGLLYYSKPGISEISSIIWHFPLSEVRPNEFIYKLLEDIYPTSFALFGSNDRMNWIELVFSNTSMCPEDLIYGKYDKDEIYKYYCKEYLYSIKFDNTKPYKYIKYTQYSNSWLRNTSDKYLIINGGIDIGGKFTTDYAACTLGKYVFPFDILCNVQVPTDLMSLLTTKLWISQ